MLPLTTVVLVARADETSATSVHTRYNIIRFWRCVVAGMGSCECGLRLAQVIFRVVSLTDTWRPDITNLPEIWGDITRTSNSTLDIDIDICGLNPKEESTSA